MKFKLVESIDDRLIEERLNEFLSESKFNEPIRTIFTIDFKNTDIDINTAQKQIKTIISNVQFKPELLIGEDGSYQLCFPGKADWRNVIISKLKHEVSDKLKFNILDK